MASELMLLYREIASKAVMRCTESLRERSLNIDIILKHVRAPHEVQHRCCLDLQCMCLCHFPSTSISANGNTERLVVSCRRN